MRRSFAALACALTCAPAALHAQRGWAIGGGVGKILVSSGTSRPESQLDLTVSYAPIERFRLYAGWTAAHLGRIDADTGMTMYTTGWTLGAVAMRGNPMSRMITPFLRGGLGFYSAYQPDWRQYATGRSLGVDLGAGVVVSSGSQFTLMPGLRFVSFGSVRGFGNGTTRYDLGRVNALVAELGVTYSFGGR